MSLSVKVVNCKTVVCLHRCSSLWSRARATSRGLMGEHVRMRWRLNGCNSKGYPRLDGEKIGKTRSTWVFLTSARTGGEILIVGQSGKKGHNLPSCSWAVVSNNGQKSVFRTLHHSEVDLIPAGYKMPETSSSVQRHQKHRGSFRLPPTCWKYTAQNLLGVLVFNVYSVTYLTFNRSTLVTV